MAINIIGQIAPPDDSVGQESAPGVNILGRLMNTEEEWEAIKQDAYGRALEAYNQTKEMASAAPQPTAADLTTEFGMPISPEELAATEAGPPTYEGYTAHIEKLRTSPSRYVMEEGLREAYPFAFGGKEDYLKNIPSFERTFGREKTLGESALQFGTTIAAELPLIIASEGIAGAVLPATFGRAAMSARRLRDLSKLETLGRAFKVGVRLGTTGAVYETSRDVADQLLGGNYPTLQGVTKDAFKGFVTWGGLGFSGTVGAKTFLGVWKRLGGRLSPVSKLAKEAENANLSLQVTEPLEEYGGRRAYVISGPRGFQQVFTNMKTARRWLRHAVHDNIGIHAKHGNLDDLRVIWDNTTNFIRKELVYNINPGWFDSKYNKLFGGMKYLFIRAEKAVFGKKAMKDLESSLLDMGVQKINLSAAKATVLSDMYQYRLWSRLGRPISEAEPRSRKLYEKLRRFIENTIEDPIAKESKALGKAERQFSVEVADYMMAAKTREDVPVRLIRNNLMHWRSMIDEAKGNTLPAVIEDVFGRIQRFMRQHHIPEEATYRLRALAIRGKKLPTQKDIAKVLGGYIKAGTDFSKSDYYRRIYTMSPEQVRIARHCRRFYNRMCRLAGLPPQDYMENYVSAKNVRFAEDFNAFMRRFPKHHRAHARFFALMHRDGKVFHPELDIRALMNMYAWGASRAAYMLDIINFGVDKVVPKLSGPLKEVVTNYLDDTIVGRHSREKLGFFKALGAKLGMPYQVFSDLYDTMLACTYGSLMGMRPWLWGRNALQPMQTTWTAMGPRFTKSFLRGYSRMGSKRAWKEFLAEAIHLKGGEWLPLGDEIMRVLKAAEARMPTDVSWTGLRKVLGVIRAISYQTTRPYGMVDTFNRGVSYWSARSAVESGMSNYNVVRNLADRVRVILEKLPKKAVKGSVRKVHMYEARGKAITELATSREMRVVLKKCGIWNTFDEVVVQQDFARPLAEILLSTREAGRGIGLKLDYYIAQQGREKIIQSIREVFLGKTGTYADEIKAAGGVLENMPKGVEGFYDSLGRRAGRQLCNDTQWQYARKEQPEFLQYKIFGQFGTWSANWIDFVRRHLTEVGDKTVRAEKAALLAATTFGIYQMLTSLGIKGTHLWLSYTPHMGGPYFQAALDAVKVIHPYTTKSERRLSWGRLKGLAGLQIPGYVQTKSLYQTLEGKKAPIPGILGAPATKPTRSAYSRGGVYAFEDKMTDRRMKHILKLYQQVLDADKIAGGYKGTRLEAHAVEYRKEFIDKLHKNLNNLTGTQIQDPLAVARRLLKHKGYL